MLFGVKKYADALWEVVRGRGINVHLRQHLVEVRPDTKEAVFEHLDSGELETVRQHNNMAAGNRKYMSASFNVR